MATTHETHTEKPDTVESVAQLALDHLRAIPTLTPENTFAEERAAWRVKAKDLTARVVACAKKTNAAKAVPVELVSQRSVNDHPGSMLFEDAVVFQHLSEARAALLTSFVASA